MISLTTALEGVCTLWPRSGKPREVPMIEFVTGNHANVLAPGELLRSIHLPATALKKDLCLSTLHSDASWPVRSPADRHAVSGTRHFSPHDHCRHAAPRAASV
jgi:CO/xanthine dehydrogenase FAD-binding subunit